ncbi:MAG: hypothetical protein JWO89_2738 [Verrucomicrobiaceae bacterium]|nr:hypothetical protein [Verrucomicrobiaceae bacterium]
MSIILALIILPFTPMAAKIKRALIEIAKSATSTKIIMREVTREVPREIVRVEKVEVRVPTPPLPPPLPDKFVPRKEMDVTTLYNGITINTNLDTTEGGHAIKEVEDPNAYKVTFNLSVRVPKANQSIDELAEINPNLPKMLPGLGKLVAGGKVSGFYHKLYDTKTTLIKRDLSRLNKLLDRHNFFDCETILELKDPTTARKALLIQSEMDVVADGSDGDRSTTLDESIAGSDYYQPSTSYFWKKQTSIANPLMARWQVRLENAANELGKKGVSAERTRSLKALSSQLKTEIEDMKAHSSLIADSDPFIVLSLLFKPYIGNHEHAPQMGDYAVVIHGKQILPAICGDYGPSMKMGEASLFLAKQINAKATPYNRGEDSLKVTYLIFPGTAKKPFNAPKLEDWRNECIKYLGEMGGVGDGFSVHTWEDKFNRPELVGPPESAKMPYTPKDKGVEEVKAPAKAAGSGKKKKG